MSNLIVRTLTGIVFIAVIVGCILGGPLSSTLLYALITLLCISEFCRLTDKTPAVVSNSGVSAIWGAYAVCAVAVFVGGALPATHHFVAGIVAMLVVPPIILLCNSLYGVAGNTYRGRAIAFAAQIYIALPFCLLTSLSYPQPSLYGSGYDATIPLAIFIILWVNDTGAYCCGSLLHKRFPRQLAPVISPKKTWVGSIGGGVLCLIAAVVLWQVSGRFSLAVWLGLALVICVFGTFGDLVESKLKRTLGIKDSGHILPGHGGMLDRFDSALLAIPAVTVYLGLVTFYA